jgi:hypothetical protein
LGGIIMILIAGSPTYGPSKVALETLSSIMAIARGEPIEREL